jgi:hypothetical protein
MRQLRYPKAYGIITDYILVCKSTINYAVSEMKASAWRESFWKRYTILHRILKVKLDNGLMLDVDANGYQGEKSKKVVVGARVKVYNRPQDRRIWVYKLVGE